VIGQVQHERGHRGGEEHGRSHELAGTHAQVRDEEWREEEPAGSQPEEAAADEEQAAGAEGI